MIGVVDTDNRAVIDGWLLEDKGMESQGHTSTKIRETSMLLSRELQSPWESQCGVTLDHVHTCTLASCTKIKHTACSNVSWLCSIFILIHTALICFVRVLPFSPVGANQQCQRICATAPAKRRFTAVLLACPHPWIPAPCGSTVRVAPV